MLTMQVDSDELIILHTVVPYMRTLSEPSSRHRSIRIEPGDLHSDPHATIIVRAAAEPVSQHRHHHSIRLARSLTDTT
jgi:hypothetical protein